VGTVTRGKDAERAVTVLYHEHYAALVRLAGFLVRDLATAESIVQDAFVAVHAAWRTLPDRAAALGHLHRSVVLSSRAAPQPECGFQPEAGSAAPAGSRPRCGSREGCGMHGMHGSAIVAALIALPARQREAVVLQYFAGLPDGQIAEVMGVHEDAVQRLAARAGAALRGIFDA
jgi:DNA-directed RNA polymerase specialized sigma24 family protein